MGTKLPFSFEDIDFRSGELRFYMNSCDEEDSLLAHIEYPDNFDIIVRHGDMKKFTVSLYCGILDNCPPAVVYKTDDTTLLRKALDMAAVRAEKELEEKRFSYYGRLWETEYITVRE